MNSLIPELTRRGFISSVLALTAAPAIVRAESLMKIKPIPQLSGVLRWDGQRLFYMSSGGGHAEYEAGMFVGEGHPKWAVDFVRVGPLRHGLTNTTTFWNQVWAPHRQ